MLLPNISRNISRIIPFGLIWLFFGIIYSLLEKSLLGDLQYYPSTGNPYDFTGFVFIFLCFVTVSGLFIGSIEVLFLNKLFVQKSFSKKIVYKSTIYAAIMITFLLVSTVISNYNVLQTSLFDEEVLNNVWVFSTSFAFWSVQPYILAIIYVSLFYAEVSENLGHEVLNNFFTGKYHKPIQENRVFIIHYSA